MVLSRCKFSKHGIFLLIHFLTIGIGRLLNVRLVNLQQVWKLDIHEGFLILASVYALGAIVRFLSGVIVDRLGHGRIHYIMLTGSSLTIVVIITLIIVYAYFEIQAQKHGTISWIKKTDEESNYYLLNKSVILF